MALVSLKDTYPDYRNTFSDDSLSHLDDYSVYAGKDNKVGSIEDGLFDDGTGQFRYLIVDTGGWIFGKKVLLPIGKARFDNSERRVYVDGLTKEQVENLPKYDGSQTVDYDYEENVRGVYRENSVNQSVPVEGAAMGAGKMGTQTTPTYNRDTYNYDYDPALYQRDADVHNDQTIRLYEERLIADKQRVRAGEVAVGKHVTSETANVAIPVEKERVVIERSTPTGTTATTRDHAFNDDDEVARVEVYEERANVGKEAFVREEVNVRKETEQEVVNQSAKVRREELDVDTTNDVKVTDR